VGPGAIACGDAGWCTALQMESPTWVVDATPLLPSNNPCTVNSMWHFAGSGVYGDPLGTETAGGARIVAVGDAGCIMTRVGVLPLAPGSASRCVLLPLLAR
jgi:hypothetical protein